MRVRCLEIRWHDSKPIYACDFQPYAPHSKKQRAKDKESETQLYRLATGGGDNNVRIWMIHTNFSTATSSTSGTSPKVEYLATLKRHSGAVNVVRFSPSGELLASAGDDGMIIIWAPSDRPSLGLDLSAEEAQYEKEYWRVKTSLRCTSQEVYDIAWNPTGEYIISGSTDNTARIFNVTEGACVREIAEHNHYVQGVAWDPMNEYIATQSSDRSVHVYSISTKHGVFEAHAVGKNTRMHVRHSRTPSASRPKPVRHSSITSDAESAITTASEVHKDDLSQSAALLTPSTSVASTPSAAMFPPPMERPSSRRSSFSGSNAPGSPQAFTSKYRRSPSPMPPLPAIRTPASPAAWAAVKLYGDETVTNFFRRLAFSPDGALLLTPAGQLEDPSTGSSRPSSSKTTADDTPVRPKKGSAASDVELATTSCVYIYSRANFSRPPVAHLPGYKKTSVAVKFSPMLYDLRAGVVTREATDGGIQNIQLERDGKETSIMVDISGPPQPRSEVAANLKSVESESMTFSTPSKSSHIPSPVLSATDLTPGTPFATLPSSGSVFALPYRMLFAVATQDAVFIHDTQQAGPVCMLSKLHYDSFTDMAWSHDGRVLMLASSDGYCSIVIFDEELPIHHTQQHNLQLQTIAHLHSAHPPTVSQSPASASMPSPSPVSQNLPPPALTPPARRPTPSKRPLTPATSVDENHSGSTPAIEQDQIGNGEPVKKKRRVALTHHGDLAS